MKRQWWHGKIAYQIYPKSFCDSDGDGIGDIRGIIGKLDYLKELGVDIIWISPIYQSPFIDQGYDISDYYKIDPAFGTMEDFDQLLAEAKKRDMYLLMDLVINHCSDKHEWFQKALREPEGEYGKYFYFEKGKDGKAPSNYRSYFGGSVWEPVPGTDLYYLHLFAKEQPDLNWENPKVLEELFRMVNWWLDKGLAGFRIDAIMNVKKTEGFPDYEPDGDDGLVMCTRMIEEAEGIGGLFQKLKQETFEKHDAFTVAEVFNMKEGELEKFIGDEGYFSTMFDFAPLMAMAGGHGWYDAPGYDFFRWRQALMKSQTECGENVFYANIIENHDEPRGASTYLPEYAQNNDGTKMLATVSILLRGLPFLYQGQEIGMKNCKMKDIDEYNDIDTKNQYKIAREAGLSEEEAMYICFKHSRDNARTPMQWNAEENAGFTAGIPWMKLNPNYKEINVETEEKDSGSVLSYYKKLLALRKQEEYREVFTYGDFVPEMGAQEQMLFAFHRKKEQQDILVAANFGKEEIVLSLEKKGKMLLKNQEGVLIQENTLIQGNRLILPSCGAAVIEL